MALHPAEHRGYRELLLSARRLEAHWAALHPRLPEVTGRAAVAGGAAEAGRLLGELEPLLAAHGLHGRPAARAAGSARGIARGAVGDRFLEVAQALRLAGLPLRHVLALLVSLGAVARGRDEPDLAAFCERWGATLRARDATLDTAISALGASPDAMVAPLDPSPAGRAAHAVGLALGALGEWVDDRAATRR